MKPRQLFIDVLKRTTAVLTATAMFVGPTGVMLANPPNHERGLIDAFTHSAVVGQENLLPMVRLRHR